MNDTLSFFENLKSWTEKILQVHTAYDIVKDPVLIDILKTVAHAQPQWFASTLVYIKTEKKKDGVIAGLAILRKYSTKLFKEAFPMVIWTAEDLITFVDINRQMGLGLGKSAKTAIAQWLTDNITEDMAITYRDKLADIILMIHMPPSNIIFDYIIAAKKHVDNEKLQQVYKKYPKIGAFEAAKYFAEKGKVHDAIQVINAYSISPNLLHLNLKEVA